MEARFFKKKIEDLSGFLKTSKPLTLIWKFGKHSCSLAVFYTHLVSTPQSVMFQGLLPDSFKQELQLTVFLLKQNLLC